MPIFPLSLPSSANYAVDMAFLQSLAGSNSQLCLFGQTAGVDIPCKALDEWDFNFNLTNVKLSNIECWDFDIDIPEPLDPNYPIDLRGSRCSFDIRISDFAFWSSDGRYTASVRFDKSNDYEPDVIFRPNSNEFSKNYCDQRFDLRLQYVLAEWITIFENPDILSMNFKTPQPPQPMDNTPAFFQFRSGPALARGSTALNTFLGRIGIKAFENVLCSSIFPTDSPTITSTPTSTPTTSPTIVESNGPQTTEKLDALYSKLQNNCKGKDDHISISCSDSAIENGFNASEQDCQVYASAGRDFAACVVARECDIPQENVYAFEQNFLCYLDASLDKYPKSEWEERIFIKNPLVINDKCLRVGIFGSGCTFTLTDSPTTAPSVIPTSSPTMNITTSGAVSKISASISRHIIELLVAMLTMFMIFY